MKTIPDAAVKPQGCHHMNRPTYLGLGIQDSLIAAVEMFKHADAF